MSTTPLHIGQKDPRLGGKVSFALHGPAASEPTYWYMSAITNNVTNAKLVIETINRYWSTLSPQEQLDLHHIYLSIHNILELAELDEGSGVNEQLNALVIDLLDTYHPYERVKAFIDANPILLPKGLKEDYDIDAPEGPVTYLKHEYNDLLVYAIQCKALLLVWGAYVTGARGELGTTHKEYYALKLLRGSKVTQSPPYRRLQEYIEARVGNMKLTEATVYMGLSSTEYADWFFALVSTRRLAIADLTHGDGTEQYASEDMSIIRKIYNYVQQKIDNMEKTFSSHGKIKDKGSSSNKGSEDDKTSVAEEYKIKEKLSEGDQMAYTVYLENFDVAKQIDPTIPDHYVKVCSELYRNNLAVGSIPKVQTTLMSWILSPVIGARKLEMLEVEGLRAAPPIVQALLIHWLGDLDLAILLTSKPVPLPSNHMVGTRIEPLSKEDTIRLVKIMPNFSLRRTKSVHRNKVLPNRVGVTEQQLLEQNLAYNPIIDTLDKLASQWGNVGWQPQRGIFNELSQLDPKLKYGIKKGEYGYAPPSDIKKQLVKIVLIIHELMGKS